MLEEWRTIIAGVTSPARARPQLERCLQAYRQYTDAIADHSKTRIRAIADIERRLNAARARVFAAGTGVVPAEVTAIEREWLAAARAPTASRDLETLWRQVAPGRWVAAGRAVPTSAEAIVALASAPEAVEEAEHAAHALRAALERSGVTGVTVGPRVDWICSRQIVFAVRAAHLFSAVLADLGDVPHEATQRAHRVRQEVRAQLGELRIETRNSSIGHELGWLAFASTTWRAVRTEPDPFAPYLAIYQLGFVPTAVDASGVTLTALPVTS